MPTNERSAAHPSAKMPVAMVKIRQWGELDPEERRAAIEKLYHEYVSLIDQDLAEQSTRIAREIPMPRLFGRENRKREREQRLKDFRESLPSENELRQLASDEAARAIYPALGQVVIELTPSGWTHDLMAARISLGRKFGLSYAKCPSCNGRGVRLADEWFAQGMSGPPQWTECESCEGERNFVHTFGNESAVRSEREVAREGGLVMSTLGVARG